MKKTLSIAKNVFLLILRGGGAWVVIGILSLLVTLAFWFANSDGKLLNELQIRIRYSIMLVTGILEVHFLCFLCFQVMD